MNESRYEALVIELDQANKLKAKFQPDAEFRHLERAHILAQPSVKYHSIVHIRMLAWAVRQRDTKEIAGQLFRLLVAAPASLVGKFPVGNTGGSRVSAFQPMDPPEDLKKVISSSEQ